MSVREALVLLISMTVTMAVLKLGEPFFEDFWTGVLGEEECSCLDCFAGDEAGSDDGSE